MWYWKADVESHVVGVRRDEDDDDDDDDDDDEYGASTTRERVHRVRDEGNGAMDERSTGRTSVQRVRRAVSATVEKRRRHPLW